jgi:hypothetical protein
MVGFRVFQRMERIVNKFKIRLKSSNISQIMKLMEKNI